MGSTLSSTLNNLPPIRDLVLPTPEGYITLLNIFQYFPLVTIAIWLTSWWPAGKTSPKNSIFNINGRVAWFVMEITGPVNLLYILYNLPSRLNMQTLPLPNKLVAGLYLLHYFNRAIISPFFAAPSMSPIHVFVMGSAIAFNWLNSACLAGWLVGYNISTVPSFYPISASPATKMPPTTPEKVLEDSMSSTGATSLLIPTIGLVLFFAGMAGNIYAERTLFALRREAADKKSDETNNNNDDKDSSTTADQNANESRPNKYHKIYIIPPSRGLFRSILYPHYVCEWLEWTGFALLGTTIFPSLTPPSQLAFPDILSTAMTGATAGLGLSSTRGGPAPPLRLAPWLVPPVWLCGKLGVPVLPLPAIMFVVNAVANMLPHARWGRKWYVERFGDGPGGVNGRGAVVPFLSWM